LTGPVGDFLPTSARHGNHDLCAVGIPSISATRQQYCHSLACASKRPPHCHSLEGGNPSLFWIPAFARMTDDAFINCEKWLDMLKLFPMKLILALLVFVAVAPKNVFAYLDPGSGSYLLQMVFGMFLGGAYFFRNFFKNLINKLVSFFKKILKK